MPAIIVVDDYKIAIKENGNVIIVGTPEISNVAVPGEKVTGEKNKTYTKNGTAIIPVGFAIVPGLDDVSEGLVISDVANDTRIQGNQFVWIPVAKSTIYERNKTYADTEVSKATIDDIGYLPDGITNEEQTVKNAGGFYIARYEAGKEVIDKKEVLVTKKGASVWLNIPQENAKLTAKTMFTDNSHVKSALISGIQWDMVMTFIASKPRIDGTSKPYEVTVYDSNRHKGEEIGVELAGNNEADRVCNIYDLEGNAWELIAEKNTYRPSDSYVGRGGFCNSDDTRPVSYRGFTSGIAGEFSSFRLALYII